MRPCLRSALVLAGGLLAGVAGAAPERAAELHYRAILFDFYQDDYLAASTRSLAYEDQQVLGARRSDAELLRGGMFLSYGLFDEADRTFRGLLEQAASDTVRDRAWFHLGRLAYQRNDLDTADAALERVGDDAEAWRRDRRNVLMGLIAMRRGDYGAALDRLAAGGEEDDTGHYARYNMGIAALRAGRAEQGRELLQSVARVETDQPEMLALRDKANVALGFDALRREDAKAAGQAFDNVRITGPFATQALLGAGWAAARDGEHRRALAAWRRLMARDITAPAVQEAYLAAPHGMLQLGAEQQAAEAYRDGIEAYNGELERLERALAAVRSGDMASRLRRAARHSRSDAWPLEMMRETPGGEYLPALLARHDFQRAAANFRDLYALQRHLNYWAQSMDGFDRMLETRRQRYQRNLNGVDQALADLDIAALKERRTALARRIDRIEAEHDALALATPRERERLDRLSGMKERLADLPIENRAPLARRREVLTGYQRWLIATDFSPRLWKARKALKQLDESIAELEAQRRSLIQAGGAARQRFQGFAERIGLARARVSTLLPRVNAAIQRQREHLESLAEAALQRRAERLRGYLAQARFALAQLHDRARNRGGGEAAQ